MNGDGRLDARERFMRDIFVIEEILLDDKRRRIKSDLGLDNDSDN